MTPNLHLSADQLAVLRWVGGGCKPPLPIDNPALVADILDALTDRGYVTYRGAVGSELVPTDAGLAYLKAHTDE